MSPGWQSITIWVDVLDHYVCGDESKRWRENEKCHFSHYTVCYLKCPYYFWLRRRTRADEATVCMLNNDLEPFLIETLWILRGGWAHCSRNVFAPVSSLLGTEGQPAIGLQDATSSATTSQRWCWYMFSFVPSSRRGLVPSHMLWLDTGGGWRGGVCGGNNQPKYFRSCLFVLPSVFRAEV